MATIVCDVSSNDVFGAPSPSPTTTQTTAVVVKVLTGKSLSIKVPLCHTADGECDAMAMLDSLVEAVAEAANVFTDEVELFLKADGKMVSLWEAFDPSSSKIPFDDNTTSNEMFAVFRLRGGKGKAGFQKALKRKGREFTRVLRTQQQQAARATNAVAAPAHRHRFNTTNANNRAEGGAQRFVRRAGYAHGRGHHHSGHSNANGEEAADLPPNHPIEILKREQAREQAQLSEWAGKVATAIGHGTALMKAQHQVKTDAV